MDSQVVLLKTSALSEAEKRSQPTVRQIFSYEKYVGGAECQPVGILRRVRTIVWYLKEGRCH